ncbi:MAG: translocation/assembly module TamB domain-containing protein [Polyangiales bacterium]
MRRKVVLFVEILAWLVLAVGLFVASVLFHLDTPVGHRYVRLAANILVTDLIAGRLDIGRVDHVGLDEIRVAHVSLYDRHGTKVIQADRIKLVIDAMAGLDGKLRFSHASLWHGMLRLEETPDGSLTFLDSFSERVETPPSPDPLKAYVEDMHLHDVTAYGSLLGLHGLRARGLEVEMRMEFAGNMKIHVFSASGQVVEPFPFLGQIDEVSAVIRGDRHMGTDLRVRAHTDGDRAHVRLYYRVPEGRPATDPMELDLLIHADPVHMTRLAEAGFDWASIFHGQGSGYVRLYGPPSHLRLAGQLVHEAGVVTLRGELPTDGDIHIQAISPGIQVDRLFPTGPAVNVGGNITLTVPPTETGEPARLHANALGFDYLGYAVPTLDVDANLEENGVRLMAIDAPYGGGRLHGVGFVTYEGVYDVAVKGSIAQIAGDPNLERHVPGAHGSLSLAVRVRGDSEQASFDGQGTFRNLRYSSLAASEARWTASVDPNPHGTRLELHVESQGTTVAEFPLGNGHLTVHGVGDRYDFQMDYAGAEQSRLRSQGQLTIRGDAYALEVPSTVIARNGVEYTLEGHDITVVPGRSLQIGLVRGQGRPHDEGGVFPVFTMAGRWSARGDDDLRFEAAELDLGDLRRVFAPRGPVLAGRADVRVDLGGDLDTHPRFAAEGVVYDGNFAGLEGANLAFFVGYDASQLTIQGQLDLDRGGRFNLAGRGDFSASLATFMEAAQLGDYDVTFTAESVDLARLRPLLGPDTPELRGRIGGTMHATGPIFLQPNFQGRIDIPDLQVAGFPRISVQLETQYDFGSLAAHATASDREGVLLEGDGSVQIDVAQALRDPTSTIETLALMPWRFSLRMPPRLAATLPAPLTVGLPPLLTEFTIAGSLSLSGGAYRPRGTFLATFEHTGNSNRFVCGREARPRGHVEAELRDGVTTADLTAMVGNDRIGRLEVRVPTPLDQWLSAATTPAIPPVDLDLEVDYDDLGSAPYFCENFAGGLDGEIHVRGLFTDAPTVEGGLRSEDLRIRRLERNYVGALRIAISDTQPVRLDLGIHGDAHHATLDGDVHFPRFGLARPTEDGTSEGAGTPPPAPQRCEVERRDCTIVHGDVAWSWNATDTVPVVADDAPFEARLTAERMPLQLPLAFISLFGRADGVIDGTITGRGTLATPELGGRLTVSDARVDLRSIGQRLRDLHGEVFVETGRIRFTDFEARDQDGRVNLDGSVDLDGFLPQRLHLETSAHQFPVRQESTIVATLTGEATMDALLDSSSMDGNVRIADLDIRLPDETQRDPIELQGHSDIVVLSRAPAVESTEEPYRIHLLIDASRAFWVRSQMFSTQVAANLDVLYADPDFRVAGSADLRRGFFEVMGKRFEIEQGGLAFDGGPRLNPEVNLLATAQLRGGSNNTVSVRASGRLAEPEIVFSSPLVPSGDQGQIICLLMTGSSSGQCGENAGQTNAANTMDATQQAASFLTSVAFGILTLSLRKQFGDFIPVIAVETGNQGYQSARVRAGFNANALIPRSMRNVVQGMYIEGFFSVGGTSTTSTLTAAAASANVITSQSVGFLMELQFPHSIVGTGAFSPPSNFSLDVTWEP